MVVPREIPTKPQIHGEIRLQSPAILEEQTPSRLQLVEVVTPHRRAVLSRLDIVREACAAGIDGTDPAPQDTVQIFGVGPIRRRSIREVGRKVVFNRRRCRIVGDQADIVEGEPRRRIVVVVLLAIVRKPKVQKVLAALPGNIIRGIHKRIKCCDGKMIVEHLARTTNRTWTVDLRICKTSRAGVISALPTIEQISAPELVNNGRLDGPVKANCGREILVLIRSPKTLECGTWVMRRCGN